MKFDELFDCSDAHLLDNKELNVRSQVNRYVKRVHYSPVPDSATKRKAECGRVGNISDLESDVTCRVCRRTNLFRKFAIGA
jgi:hypothetical protein